MQVRKKLQVTDVNTRAAEYVLRRLKCSERRAFLNFKNIMRKEGEEFEVCGSSNLSRLHLNNSILKHSFKNYT
jgi:hypothetical protein